ncbi:hypothetical protein [Thalassospira australica]|uniref:hypothetical protein n=1 Tax=Thalassospira australica TaxID=1528106 RepID=UPI00051A23F9|nr:hypothetical protein [Thalassospira australica]
MIEQLTDILADQAKVAARKCAAFAAIGVVMLIGAGFLLAAIYIAIAASFGAIAAALALGGTLVTLSLVALAIMLQRDPGEGIDQSEAQRKTAQNSKSEDDMLFDLLVHSAMTGYATGQGNKPRMQAGFDQMIDDLGVLGVFDPPGTGPQDDERSDTQNTDTKMAG